MSSLPNLMEEPFAVSNPSIRLLKRMAVRLGERVSYLIGESEESDPVWIESNASCRKCIYETPGVDAGIALRTLDELRSDYAMNRRTQQSSASFRKPTPLMTVSDWDRRYQQRIKTHRRHTPNAKQSSLI